MAGRGGPGGKLGAAPSRAERSGAEPSRLSPRPSHFAPGARNAAPTHPGRPHTSARGCAATGGPALPARPRGSHRTAPPRSALPRRPRGRTRSPSAGGGRGVVVGGGGAFPRARLAVPPPMSRRGCPAAALQHRSSRQSRANLSTIRNRAGNCIPGIRSARCKDRKLPRLSAWNNRSCSQRPVRSSPRVPPDALPPPAVPYPQPLQNHRWPHPTRAPPLRDETQLPAPFCAHNPDPTFRPGPRRCRPGMGQS